MATAAGNRHLRKGELLTLRKTDIELEERRMTVSRSYDSETTKGGHADVVPLANEVVPYLAYAVAQSLSVLVFPGEDGGRTNGRLRRDASSQYGLRIFTQSPESASHSPAPAPNAAPRFFQRGGRRAPWPTGVPPAPWPQVPLPFATSAP